MRNWCLCASLVLLTACGGSDPQEKSESAPGGVIPQRQLDALNQAKGMEDALQQAGQKQREQIDQMGE